MALPAFPVNTSGNEIHKISIKIKSNVSSAEGVYLRIFEYNDDLPSGKTAVSDGVLSSNQVQISTSSKYDFYENQAVSTSWETHEYTYTPSADAKWASIVVLNWTELGTNSLFVKDPTREIISNVHSAYTATPADITSTIEATDWYVHGTNVKVKVNEAGFLSITGLVATTATFGSGNVTLNPNTPLAAEYRPTSTKYFSLPAWMSSASFGVFAAVTTDGYIYVYLRGDSAPATLGDRLYVSIDGINYQLD